MTRCNKNNQSGVVLAIVMIFLLVLTLVSVTTLNSSSTQTSVAGNTQLKQIAFQNAESSARAAELAWDTALNSCRSLADCTIYSTPPIIDKIEDIDWDAITVNGGTAHGKYAVEYLGWRPQAGEDDQRIILYRITARGQDANARAVTYIQTLYQKCFNKDGAPCSRS